MAKIEACKQIGCEMDGRNCDPVYKGCSTFLENDFRLTPEGNLECMICLAIKGTHEGWCSKKR